MIKILKNLEGHNDFNRQTTENVIFQRQKSQFLAATRHISSLFPNVTLFYRLS